MPRRNNRPKRRSQLDAMDQINVTPLLDLTFILLIVFMITMPLIEYGTSVSPPQMNSDELPKDEFINVVILEDGTIELEKTIVDDEALFNGLKEARDKNPKVVILLKADGVRSYKEVLELMAKIRRAGFADVTLVTAAEEG